MRPAAAHSRCRIVCQRVLQRVAARASSRQRSKSAPEREMTVFHGDRKAGEAFVAARQPSLSSSFTAVTGAVCGASTGRAATPTRSSVRAGGTVKNTRIWSSRRTSITCRTAGGTPFGALDGDCDDLNDAPARCRGDTVPPAWCRHAMVNTF